MTTKQLATVIATYELWFVINMSSDEEMSDANSSADMFL